MKKISSLLCLALGCFALSCSRSARQEPEPQPTGDARIVATVDGLSITVADLQAEVERRKHGRSLAAVGLEERDALLQQLVRNQSVYARAVAEGFDQSTVMRRQIRELIVSRYLEQHARSNTPPEVSASDIQRFYDENSDKFSVPAQIRFAVIKIGVSPKATDAKRAETFERAKSILEQARANEPFESLVRLHSEDQATRYRGGDVGWISRDNQDRWCGAIVETAFALENPGDLGPVVTTSDAFYLIRLVERKQATHRPLNEVKAAIAYQVSVINRQRAEAQFFEGLQSNQKIEINRVLLDSLSTPVQQTEIKPPGVPAG